MMALRKSSNLDCTERSFMVTKQTPNTDFIIENILRERSITMIYAPPAAGKTAVARDMALAIASGSKLFANKFPVNGQRKVLYMTQERIPDLYRCLQKQAIYQGTSEIARESLIIMENVPNFSDENHKYYYPGVVSYIQSHNRYDVLIIDHLQDSLGRINVASPEAICAVVGLKEMLEELNCAMIVLQHTNKNGITEGGIAQFRAITDITISLTGSSSVRNFNHRMIPEKLSLGTDSWEPVPFHTALVPGSNDALYIVWDKPSEKKSKVVAEKPITVAPAIREEVPAKVNLATAERSIGIEGGKILVYLLENEEGITSLELAKVYQIPSRLHALIKKLLDFGYISSVILGPNGDIRQRSCPGSTTTYTLTEFGEELAENIIPRTKKQIKEMLKDFPE